MALLRCANRSIQRRRGFHLPVEVLGRCVEREVAPIVEDLDVIRAADDVGLQVIGPLHAEISGAVRVHDQAGRVDHFPRGLRV